VRSRTGVAFFTFLRCAMNQRSRIRELEHTILAGESLQFLVAGILSRRDIRRGRHLSRNATSRAPTCVPIYKHSERRSLICY
jgi:hypothetical protein